MGGSTDKKEHLPDKVCTLHRKETETHKQGCFKIPKVERDVIRGAGSPIC